MRGNRRVIPLLTLLITLAALSGCAPDQEMDRLYQDGIFTGSSPGTERGYAEVVLIIEDGQIVNVSITEFNGLGVAKDAGSYLICVGDERIPLLLEVYPTLAGQIVEQNSWDVDGVSGATGTSGNIREAARFALAKARVEPAPTTFFDGTFMAMSDATEHGWHIAWVTIENDKIVDIRLEGTVPKKEAGEIVIDEAGRRVFAMKTEEYPLEHYHEARLSIAQKIIETQNPAVDSYTGATDSSNDWMAAVERALRAAKTN